jgi:hypothetical protein
VAAVLSTVVGEVIMSTSTVARVIGALFLSAFLLYGGGSAVLSSTAGPLLLLANSVAVVAIGVLVQRLVAQPAYLVARGAEGVLLAVGVVFLLLREPFSTDANNACYQVAMLALGLGSLPFIRALRRADLIPGWLATWGLLGYGVFTLGATAELLGYGIGLACSVPGGLWELTFGGYLMARGASVRRISVPRPIH